MIPPLSPPGVCGITLRTGPPRRRRAAHSRPGARLTAPCALDRQPDPGPKRPPENVRSALKSPPEKVRSALKSPPEKVFNSTENA